MHERNGKYHNSVCCSSAVTNSKLVDLVCVVLLIAKLFLRGMWLLREFDSYGYHSPITIYSIIFSSLLIQKGNSAAVFHKATGNG